MKYLSWSSARYAVLLLAGYAAVHLAAFAGDPSERKVAELTGLTPHMDGTDAPGTVASGSEEAHFLALLNQYRAENGAGPLQISVTLETSATWMSQDMAARDYAGHVDSLGRSFRVRLSAFRYRSGYSGENVGAGFPDAQNIFSGFQNACDPEPSGRCTYAHRQNMLNPSFKAIGIGRAYNPRSSYHWFWTTDFGGVVDRALR